MKDKLEWLVVCLIFIIGIYMITMLTWATLVGTWHFIVAFFTTLGAKFIYSSTVFIILLFILIQFAEDQPKIEGK